jgi:5-methyltetrahydropteroyltriglutamate--homocysteine methyltransferase
MAMDINTMRVDLVGSLLRPQQLKQAFADYGRGQISDADLKSAQDAAIRDVVAKQAAHNLPVVVDGEFRRTSFMESFAVVAGVEEWQTGARTYHDILARKDDGKEVTHKGQDPILLNRKRVTAPLKLIRNTLADDFRFAQSLTDRPVKVTLIGPDRIQQCYDSEASKAVYPSTNEFLQDVVKVERQMLSELTQAGCRYVGIDGPGYTAYVDADSIAAMRARGEEPMATMERSIRADNEVIANFPGVTLGFTSVAATGKACGIARESTMPSLKNCSVGSSTSGCSWNTTPNALAVSSRCALSPRGRSPCWV